MLQKEQYIPSKIILLQVFTPPTKTSHSTCETTSHTKQYLCSTSCDDKYQTKMTIQMMCLHWRSNLKQNNDEVGAGNATKATKTITIKQAMKKCQLASRRELTD